MDELVQTLFTTSPHQQDTRDWLNTIVNAADIKILTNHKLIIYIDNKQFQF